MKFGLRGGHEKIAQKKRSFLKGGGFQIVSSVFLQKKHVFITIGVFVWLIFILAVINRSVLSCGLLFTKK